MSSNYYIAAWLAGGMVAGHTLLQSQHHSQKTEYVQDVPLFTLTGVDFTRALYVKQSNREEGKVYICLFTCATSRAVHLEVVTDL